MIPLEILMDVTVTPIYKEYEEGKRIEPQRLADVSALGILTKGTEEGRPVVIVRMQLADGNFVLGQTTLRLMQGAMRAFAARYGEA